MQVAIPADIHEVKCTECGGDTIINPNYSADVREDDGKTHVFLICSDENCVWRGCVYSWLVTEEEYLGLFGHPGFGIWPVPPEYRELPPGPWGVFKVQPSTIPDEAWQITCPNNVPKFSNGPICGGYLIPNPGHVFYYTEFSSTVTVGLRCPKCQQIVLETASWSLTPELHLEIFGRPVGEYRPEYDPDDPDDFEAKYSMWRTADRWGLQHFRSLDDLIGSEDYDLLSIGPGEWTVRHWETGGEWDMPEFVAEYRERIKATYEDQQEGWGDEDDDDEGE